MSASTEHIDAAYTETTGSALATRESRPLAVSQGVVPVVSPQEARAQMQAYQELVRAIITEDDEQTFTEKKNGRTVTKRFKKKSAVKKIQTFFGFSISIIDKERYDLGEGHFGWAVTARATSPNGRFVDGLAGCSTHEERFDLTPYDDESEQRFEKRQRKALARSFHDVLSTAETRASNRAAMNLVGAGETTAEEMGSRGRNEPPANPPQRTERGAASPQDDAARKDALDTVARGWAALGLTTPAQYADRVRKVADPNTPWDELSLLELQRLGKVLAREYRESQRAPGNGLDTAAYAASGDRDGGERDARPEPVQCTECTGLDGQHLDDDLGPCVNDQSERALRIRAGEVQYDRNPQMEELPL